MTQRWWWRLHVENRLAELRAKYGREGEDDPLPDWLDHYPEPEPEPKPEPPKPVRPRPAPPKPLSGRVADW